jgi:hypothetical protein
MPSPFPGMDPYLEDHWRDVHTSLSVYIRDALQAALSSSLRARIEERVVPDVRIIDYQPELEPRQAAGVAIAEPMRLVVEPEPLTEPFIEIIDIGSRSRNTVTSIEILSPAIKTPGAGMTAYLRKQQEVCNSETSLVEIDLLRAGKHVLAVPLSVIPSKQRTAYMTCVRRAWDAGMAEVYPMPASEPLPKIKIPLRQDEADIVLDLQPLIQQCYEDGAYDGDINYNKDPNLPFTEEEARWADPLLRQAGVRTTPPPGPGKRRRRKPPETS